MANETIFNKEFAHRKARNPRYSLRAFARDLGISPASISRICQGTQSPGLAVVKKLVASTQTSPRLRQALIAEYLADQDSIPSLESARTRVALSPEDILCPPERMIVLIFVSLVELIDLSSRPTVSAAAKRLGMSPRKLKEHIASLVGLGVLIQTVTTAGNIVIQMGPGHYFVQAHRSVAAIRAFHKDMIDRAKHALADTSQSAFLRREISSETVTMNSKDMESLRQLIGKFKEDVVKLCSRSDGTDLYQLNVQFFPLTQAE